MRIYLSGPITGRKSARHTFAWVEHKLRQAGETDIVNPEAILRSLQMQHNEYMHVCKALLDVSDVLLLLPDWRKSTGARIEVGIATAKHMKIYELQDDLTEVRLLKL